MTGFSDRRLCQTERNRSLVLSSPTGFSLFSTRLSIPSSIHDDNRDIAHSLLLLCGSPVLRLVVYHVLMWKRSLSRVFVRYAILDKSRSFTSKSAPRRVLPVIFLLRVTEIPLLLLSNSIPFCLDYFLSPPPSFSSFEREGGGKEAMQKTKEERHEHLGAHILS